MSMSAKIAAGVGLALIGVMSVLLAYWMLPDQRTVDDNRKACDLFKKAALMGDAKGQFKYGVCWQTGRGREKDMHKAVDWFELAAEQGITEAKNYLGTMFVTELPGHGREAEGIRILQELVAEGHLLAPMNLGVAHYEGVGTPRDMDKAIRHYELAANRGHVVAAALLHHVYSEGLYGRQPDAEAAEHWLKVFRDNRNPYFHESWTLNESIASLYEAGYGLPEDPERAAYYRSRSGPEED